MKAVLAFLSLALLPAVAKIEQIHISYTGVQGELAVDFVASSAGSAQAYTSLDKSTWRSVPATQFHALTIGYMSQALLDFKGISAGSPAFYFVSGGGDNSTIFEVTPIVSRPEVFAVYGDFGLANDVCMDNLVAEAAKGTFDSVLHVGDWAYNFDDDLSAVGNQFMNLVQGYAATHPVMPAEGNHERCSACPEIPELSAQGEPNEHNFTEYKARMHATALFAGKNAGTNTARYYSFNQGLTHFIVFTAEAYLYARDATFIANQLRFMKADLAAVDRKATPWVVALAHKDWTMEAEAFGDFSPILQDAKVDILFVGHVHYYNRFLPYDVVTKEIDQASVSADGSTYTNPKYMTVIVTGASGDHEKDDKYTKISPSFTGSENYGYGLYVAHNASYATWDYKTVKADGAGPANYADSLKWIKTA